MHIWSVWLLFWLMSLCLCLSFFNSLYCLCFQFFVLFIYVCFSILSFQIFDYINSIGLTCLFKYLLCSYECKVLMRMKNKTQGDKGYWFNRRPSKKSLNFFLFICIFNFLFDNKIRLWLGWSNKYDALVLWFFSKLCITLRRTIYVCL